jgi:hypothetical protein
MRWWDGRHASERANAVRHWDAWSRDLVDLHFDSRIRLNALQRSTSIWVRGDRADDRGLRHCGVRIADFRVAEDAPLDVFLDTLCTEWAADQAIAPCPVENKSGYDSRCGRCFS